MSSRRSERFALRDIKLDRYKELKISHREKQATEKQLIIGPTSFNHVIIC